MSDYAEVVRLREKLADLQSVVEKALPLIERMMTHITDDKGEMTEAEVLEWCEGAANLESTT
jgi:hypothetical protein